MRMLRSGLRGAIVTVAIAGMSGVAHAQPAELGAAAVPAEEPVDRAPPERAPPRVEAKFGKGVRVETADGDFAMRIGARAQLRSTVLAPEEDGEDPSVDAQVRRLRLTVEGHAFSEKVTYKIQLAFAPLDQDPVAVSAVRDAYVVWSPLRDLELKIGQGKVPFGRQRIVSSGSQQMVDRSVVTGELNLDRDVGITAFSDDLGGLDEWLGYAVGVFGGDGRNRVATGSGLLYVARLELRPLGGTPELDEPDIERSAKPRLAFGVAGAYNDTTDRARSTIGDLYETDPWVDYAHGEVDWRFKWRGFSVTNELTIRRHVGRETHTALVDGAPVTDVARSGVGGFLQAGQMLVEGLEVSARYGTMVPLGDEEEESGFPDERELGGAVSYYFAKHALKLQADYFYLFDEPGEGRHQVRAQLQIAP